MFQTGREERKKEKCYNRKTENEGQLLTAMDAIILLLNFLRLGGGGHSLELLVPAVLVARRGLGANGIGRVDLALLQNRIVLVGRVSLGAGDAFTL